MHDLALSMDFDGTSNCIQYRKLVPALQPAPWFVPTYVAIDTEPSFCPAFYTQLVFCSSVLLPSFCAFDSQAPTQVAVPTSAGSGAALGGLAPLLAVISSNLNILTVNIVSRQIRFFKIH
jgi:hypothetical protein